MRWILGLMLAGCGDMPEAALAPDVAPVETAVAAAPVPAPSPAAELCFRVDPAVRAAFPAIDERLAEAGVAWGMTTEIGDHCPNRLGLEQMAANANGTSPVAKHRPTTWTGSEWLRLSAGGTSEIVLSVDALGGIADEHEADCEDRWATGGGSRKLLSRVLTHELGHALGLGESDIQTEAMFRVSGYCLYIPPSADEIATIQRTLAP